MEQEPWFARSVPDAGVLVVAMAPAARLDGGSTIQDLHMRLSQLDAIVTAHGCLKAKHIVTSGHGLELIVASNFMEDQCIHDLMGCAQELCRQAHQVGGAPHPRLHAAIRASRQRSSASGSARHTHRRPAAHRRANTPVASPCSSTWGCTVDPCPVASLASRPWGSSECRPAAPPPRGHLAAGVAV